MKKVILILTLFAFSIVGFSQSYSLYGRTEQNYFKSTQDVTITNSTAVSVDINTLLDVPTVPQILIDVDSVSGNHTAVALTLFGRNFEDQAWTQINGPTTDQGVNSATNIEFVDTTFHYYRKFRITLTGTGTGVSKLNTLEMLLYNTGGAE